MSLWLTGIIRHAVAEDVWKPEAQARNLEALLATEVLQRLAGAEALIVEKNFRGFQNSCGSITTL